MASITVAVAILLGIGIPAILALIGGQMAWKLMKGQLTAEQMKGKGRWSSLILGIDGTYSLANLQIWLWTLTILGSYIALSIINGGFIGSINDNLLALMGISVGSTVSSAGVRAAQESGKSQERFTNWKDLGWQTLISSEKDASRPSIAKFQMLSWTVVVLLIYIVVLAKNILASPAVIEMPDIGSGLLILMGISQAGYVGNKISDSVTGD